MVLFSPLNYDDYLMSLTVLLIHTSLMIQDSEPFIYAVASIDCTVEASVYCSV